MFKGKPSPTLLKWLLENTCYLRPFSSTSVSGSRSCSTHLEPGFDVEKMEAEENPDTMVRNMDEFFKLEKEDVELKEVPLSEQRSLRVAIVGTPNSGKSTLINQLLGQKVLAVSPKAHTTCRRALGVFTDGSIQIALMDTPGTIPSGYARSLGMSRQFTADPGRSLMDADLVAVMVDAANRMTRERLDQNVIRLLEKNPHIPSVLVLNKVDLVKPKTILLPLAELLSGSDDSHRHRIGFLVRKWKDKRIPLSEKTEIKRELNKVRKELADKKRFREEYLSNLERAQIERDGVKEPEVGVVDCDHAPATPPISLKPRPLLAMNCWLYFKELFMVSALDGDGLEKLREYLFSAAKLREWDYSASEITDQPLMNLVEDVIREKICLHTDKEIPYVTRQENVIWERDASGVLTIYQYLHCGKRSRAAILVGSRGSMIQTIRDEATSDIEALLNCPVQLTLHVKK